MTSLSVIIPTLQRSPMLWPLLEIYVAHPVVCEVIVINNADEPLGMAPGKIREVRPGGNIFVNPAWNLGAELATGSVLAVSNDDLSFSPGLLDVVVDRLCDDRVGLIGPAPSCFEDDAEGPVRFRTAYGMGHGFGTLMFLRRDRWVQIPDTLRIFFGDEWLFHSQARRNLTFAGPRIVTPMSVTSGRPEFAQRSLDDQAAWRVLGGRPDTYLRRHWLGHAVARVGRRAGLVREG